MSTPVPGWMHWFSACAGQIGKGLAARGLGDQASKAAEAVSFEPKREQDSVPNSAEVGWFWDLDGMQL